MFQGRNCEPSVCGEEVLSKLSQRAATTLATKLSLINMPFKAKERKKKLTRDQSKSKAV